MRKNETVTEYLSDKYDLREAAEKELNPLIRKLGEFAERHRMPMLLIACDAVYDDEYSLCGMAKFFGAERTPNALIAAHLCVANRDREMAVLLAEAAEQEAMKGDLLLKGITALVTAVDAEEETPEGVH